jgi:hypothetical protein
MRVPEDEALAEWDWAVTVDEAYQIACDAAGMDLVRDEPGFHYEKLVGFRTPYDTPERRAYWVWAETGDFARYTDTPWHWSPSARDGATAALAYSEAVRLMPDWVPVDQMEWTVHPRTNAMLEVEGVLWGDEFPPVFPQPLCRVLVDPTAGAILRYRQYLCHNRLEAEPAITYDVALETIRAELGSDFEVITTRPSAVTRDLQSTYLAHGSTALYYHIAFRSGERAGWARVDAITGELQEFSVWPTYAHDDPNTTDTPGMTE